MLKTCTICMQEKPTTQFRPTGNGCRVRSECRDCERENGRLYEVANRERRRQARNDAYAANPVKGREKSRAYRTKYPGRQSAANRRYYEKNIEKMRERARAWVRENPVHAAGRRALRRAAEKRATPAWADRVEIQRRYDWAQLLSEEFGQVFHVDHVVPLTSPIVCGLHWHGNLAVIPATENQRKSNRRWPDMPDPEV